MMWAVFEEEFDVHVVPQSEEHLINQACWCGPIIEHYEHKDLVIHKQDTQ